MTVKRAFDIAGSLLAITVSSPLWLIAAIAVRLSSHGPIFHRAERVGRGGELFTLLKFRTMRLEGADGSSGITATRDPRITGAGRILRRLKMDELPQLLNVLRGDMSLVGPRPEDPRYVAGYTDEQRGVLALRPGITSPASIAYRHEEQLLAACKGDPVAHYRENILPAKLALDLDYVGRRTFLLDLGVLFRTLGAVFRRSSARRP